MTRAVVFEHGACFQPSVTDRPKPYKGVPKFDLETLDNTFPGPAPRTAKRVLASTSEPPAPPVVTVKRCPYRVNEGVDAVVAAVEPSGTPLEEAYESRAPLKRAIAGRPLG